ncbi:uncharacterized protein CLUP02_04928 [Colletotrichum lupini]|uniref:Uncharacterized protein n=1 Tax=Colletotrichum lupini TaxID=145971 RepID=A0A9Q8WD76_9PEZI|nr:uncharacterized protein CLUP02_04928 [Colletotrichum lupini]UQC79448.1 hypothetical protein CLUP02_04928 [Colletotrichum lupini]
MLEQEALVDWNHSMDNEAGAICRALRKIALLSGIPPERRPSPRRSTSFSGRSAPHFRVRPMLSVALSSVMYSVVHTPISLTKQMPPPPLPCPLRVKENFHFRLVTSISRSAVNILIY